MTTPPGPSDADMLNAMFNAFGSLIPGAAIYKFTPGDIPGQLSHLGAADEDIATITSWLAAREGT